MKKGAPKKKFCISIDMDIYQKLVHECLKDDAKLSTRINTILKSHILKK